MKEHYGNYKLRWAYERKMETFIYIHFHDI